jgi:hypothetical protein
MTDRSHKLRLARQADLLGISRGSLYYEPRPVSEYDLKLMRRIDELHMEYPFAGSRMMKGLLRQEGFTAGRLHVATCMKQMGIQALYRRPNTSKPVPGHIQISMDGKGAWRDNVFIERLWRTIKHEEVYLRAYDSVSGARESLGRYLTFYNTRRPHSSLDGQTPDQAYLNPSRPIPVAA